MSNSKLPSVSCNDALGGRDGCDRRLWNVVQSVQFPDAAGVAYLFAVLIHRL